MRQVLRERASQGSPEECWPWTGSTVTGGYGQLSYQNRTCTAHQVAWILENGPMPAEIDGKRPCIRHTCDNPPCVNPAHLQLGTYSDNMKDKFARGRAVVPSGDDHYARTNPEKLARGDRNGARTKPGRLARGDRHGSQTKPEAIPRGADHWTARHPEKVRRGFKMPEGSICRGEKLSPPEKAAS